MHQQPALCVFCNSPSVTAEHLVPEGLHDVVPRGPDNHEHFRALADALFDEGRDPSSFLVKARGPVRSRKLRIACKNCNEVWMGSIENSAQPILRRLIIGERPALSLLDQLTVARWAILRSIVYQYTDRSRIAIPDADRSALMRGEISPEWEVWWGALDSPLNEPAFNQRLWSEYPPSKVVDALNSASTLMAMGHLVLFTLRSPHLARFEEIVADYAPRKLVRLWPHASDLQQCDQALTQDLMFKVPNFPMARINQVPPVNHLDGARFNPYQFGGLPSIPNRESRTRLHATRRICEASR